jgi:hypothetical protein
VKYAVPFLVFTLSSDGTAKTALFTICVEEDEQVMAVAAAYSWVVGHQRHRRWCLWVGDDRAAGRA